MNRRDLLQNSISIAAGLSVMGSIKEALAEESMGFHLENFSQVAFVVNDIETSKKQFAELFGQDIPKTIISDPLEKAQTRYHGQPTEAQCKLAFFKFGKIQFELIEPIGGPSIWKEHLDQMGESVHHIAFNVENMETALKALNKKGFSTVQTGDFGTGCYAYVDTRPVLKTYVELLEIY